MKLQFYFFFIFFTLLFLFYPGNSYYFHIFAYNRSLFNNFQEKQPDLKSINPIPYVANNDYPSISAEGVYVVDLASFTPLFNKNEHKQYYPASTNKIITALVSMDNYSLEDVVTIKNPLLVGTTMELKNNEKITVENLLYGALIQSANDAAQALADHMGNEKFIEFMNKKAKELGMRNTYFTNPSGLDNSKQYTSAFDLAIAGRELLKNKHLRKIVSIKEITISDINFKYFHKLSNVNRLLGEIHGIGGLKTGHTDGAKDNLVSMYKNNGKEYLIVVLKSDDRFFDTKQIVDWIDKSIEYVDVNYYTTNPQ